MRGVVLHAPKDLRIDEGPEQKLGPHDVRLKIQTGGICGSDLHYFNHGGMGFIKIRELMVLGHEVAGSIAEVGGAETGVVVGARVAVSPSRHCGGAGTTKRRCTTIASTCASSAARSIPHVQGGFREELVVDESQAIPVTANVAMAEAAMAENAKNFVRKLTDSFSGDRDVNKVDMPDRLNIPTMLDDDAALVCQKKFWATERNLPDPVIWVGPRITGKQQCQ